MEYIRAENQIEVKVGDIVRLLPTMRWTPSPNNPIGGIGTVVNVSLGFLGIRVKWFMNSEGLPIDEPNGAYVLGEDLEILENNYIKSFSHKNKHFFIL